MSSPPDSVDDTPASQLLEPWRRNVSHDVALLHRLIARHREKHRRYHTVSHVAAVVARVADLAAVEPVLDLDATIAAAFYHDAVYEPASPANERASARLARRDLATLGWPDERIAHVAEMIEATRDHRSPPDSDHAVLFDADLSVLGSSSTDYDAYVDAVRAEYREADDDAWTAGRGRVLRGFLDRDSIYATPTGRALWESAARSNLQRELDSLAS